MLTVKDFFNNFRNNQVRPISDCSDSNVLDFFEEFKYQIDSLSGVSIFGIPDNINFEEIVNDEDFHFHLKQGVMDIQKYVDQKVTEMKRENIIYYVDNTRIEKQLSGPTNIPTRYLTKNNENKTLFSLCTLAPYRNDSRSSYWYDEPPYAHFYMLSNMVKYNQIDYKNPSHVFNMDTTICIVIPGIDDNRLPYILSRKNPQLRINTFLFDSPIPPHPIEQRINNKILRHNEFEFEKYKMICLNLDGLYNKYSYVNPKPQIIIDGNKYLIVEITYEQLMKNYHHALFNYLKLTPYWEKTCLVINDFIVKDMIEDLNIRHKVINIHDKISNLK